MNANSLLASMPMNVDLDLAQVSARANSLPCDVHAALQPLLVSGDVKTVAVPGLSRLRYKRVPRT